MKQKILATLVIIMFMTIALAVVSAAPTAFAAIGKNDEYIPHEPILILRDDNFTEANGVTRGSGTEADPFVIENWNVSYICLIATTKFFIINHCYIHDDGVFFVSSPNGTIKDCTFMYAYIHLTLESNNNYIKDCTILSNDDIGIFLGDSDNCYIEDCFISAPNNGEFGIYLADSNYNTFYRCNIEKYYCAICFTGKGGSNNNIIHCCNISDCTGEGGIYIEFGSNNKIYHNNFFNNFHVFYPSSFKIRCNAKDLRGSNQWDDGAEGNYWDNYMKIKLPILYDWDKDGIGRIPYRIFAGPFPFGVPSGKDRHPLMKPYSEN